MKMTGSRTIFLFLACFLLGIACTEEPAPTPPAPKKKKVPNKETRMGNNRIWAKDEDNRIEAWIKRRNWEVTKTSTGLRYRIYQEGNGKQAKAGMVARVNYEVKLLDGTICYSSDSTGAEDFLIGQDYVETGLHEGILNMKEGDKATLIIPPHLAHGLSGDNRKIPLHSAIVYDLELLKLYDGQP